MYKRLTNNNLEEYNPELDFCAGCKYYGEPNGCNRPNGTCGNYERFIETYNRLAELEDKIERGELVENKVVTYIDMARSGGKTLIDKALKFDELKTKIENGTLVDLNKYYLVKRSRCKGKPDMISIVSDAVKEAAEKIIKWFKENSICIPSDEYINEFAKQFRVEIKE